MRLECFLDKTTYATRLLPIHHSTVFFHFLSSSQVLVQKLRALIVRTQQCQGNAIEQTNRWVPGWNSSFADDISLVICKFDKHLNKKSRSTTKPAEWHVRPAKTQNSLGIRSVWSESSLIAWRNLESLATHWAQSEDSDRTGRMPRLIWVFAWRTGHFIGFVVLRLKWWSYASQNLCPVVRLLGPRG